MAIEQKNPAEQIEIETQPEKQTNREIISLYVEHKTSNETIQNGIYERATEFAKESADLGNKLHTEFDSLGLTIEKNSDIETIKNEFITKLTQKITEHLKGQESKLANAEKYIQQVTTYAIDSVKLQSDQITPELYAEKITDALALVSMAVEAISFQDLAANSVTLGDHGWHHLYQDMRDSLLLAEGLSDTALSAKEKLILSLTAAFHDIGYASNQVNEYQKADSKNYNLDIGHPVLSYVFLKANEQTFKKVLSDEEFAGFSQMVINHENPERASQAGEKYEKMSKAFAHADAGASVGREKVPPIISQTPEVMEYIYSLNQAQVQLDSGLITQEQYDTLVGSSKQKVESLLKSEAFNQEQATQLLNVFADAHINKNSLNFILGRLAGEMGPATVTQNSEGQKRIALEMNLGEAATIESYLPGAKKAGAVLAIKVFGEQAGITWPKDAQGKTNEMDQLIAFIQSNDSDTLTTEKNITLTVGDTEILAMKNLDKSVVLTTQTIQLTYNPEKKAVEQRDFYDKIITALSEANKKLTAAVNETSRKSERNKS